ncbi:MAG: citrate (Si)-synthase, partial [Rickettsiales bacterium]
MSKNPNPTATLDIEGKKKIELPIYRGTQGPSVIDISKLYKETGYFTYDPGFLSTASCESKITFIDGEEGTLLHR